MITNNKIKYFNVAKEVSRLSDFHKQKIGCVVTYRKQILSVGYNQSKTHTLQAIYNKYRKINCDTYAMPLIHAEVDALSKCRYLDIDWNKVEIFVYRDHKITGELMIAKPCPACMEYIRQLGIKNIYYTNYGEYCYSYLAS